MDMERLGLCNPDAAVFEKHSSKGKMRSPMFSANLCSVEPSQTLLVVAKCEPPREEIIAT